MGTLPHHRSALPQSARSSRLLRWLGVALCTTLAAGFLSASSARADVFYMCGHEIRTSYDQGWVLIDSVTGINWNDQRPDIVVYGTMRNLDRREYNETTAFAAIYARTRWGWQQSRMRIKGYPDCDVILH